MRLEGAVNDICVPPYVGDGVDEAAVAAGRALWRALKLLACLGEFADLLAVGALQVQMLFSLPMDRFATH